MLSHVVDFHLVMEVHHVFDSTRQVPDTLRFPNHHTWSEECRSPFVDSLDSFLGGDIPDEDFHDLFTDVSGDLVHHRMLPFVRGECGSLGQIDLESCEIFGIGGILHFGIDPCGEVEGIPTVLLVVGLVGEDGHKSLGFLLVLAVLEGSDELSTGNRRYNGTFRVVYDYPFEILHILVVCVDIPTTTYVAGNDSCLEQFSWILRA